MSKISRAALALILAEALLALAAGLGLIFSGSDPATQGLDRLSGAFVIFVAATFLIPAAWLAAKGRRAFLSLLLAFVPVALVALALVLLMASF